MRFVAIPKVTLHAMQRSRFALISIVTAVLCAAEYGLRYYFAVPAIAGYATYWLVLSCFFYVVAKDLVARERDDILLLVTVVMLGVTVGLCSALWKVYLYQELWTAFNLLAEPIRAGLYGFMIAWLVVHAQSNVRQATFLSPN